MNVLQTQILNLQTPAESIQSLIGSCHHFLFGESWKILEEVPWGLLLCPDAMASPDCFLYPCRASCSLHWALSAWPILLSAKVQFHQWGWGGVSNASFVLMVLPEHSFYFRYHLPLFIHSKIFMVSMLSLCYNCSKGDNTPFSWMSLWSKRTL